jgi:hypothetical protein
MARVRRVFDNSMVAHVWAQQEQDDGRSGNGNFYFVGPTIFSYGSHFAIARFTKDAHGNRCVLFTTGSYSVSTARHIRYTRGALSGLPNLTVWDVPHVRNRWNNGDPTAETHVLNAQSLAADVAEFAADMAKPNKRAFYHEDDAQMRCDAITSRAQYVFDYCQAFGIEAPNMKLMELRQAVLDAFAKFYDPKAVDTRERNREKRRIARETAEARTYQRFHAFMEGVYPFITNDEYKRLGYRDQYDYRQQAHRIQEASRNKTNKHITAAQWQDGKAGSLDWSEATLTLVRRRDDMLETSRGATCPWSHAVVAFLKAQKCRQEGIEWHRNGQQIRVGHFNVDYIDRFGNIRAGCHTLQYEEMLRLAIREVPHLVKATFALPVAA